MKGILIAGTLSTLLSFLFTPTLIKLLTRQEIGQMIRDDGPKSHHSKKGTPTMGGIVFITASVVAYLISHLVTGVALSASALLVIALIVGLGIVGFIDDYLKVAKKQSLGLTARAKLAGQALVAALFAFAGLHFKDAANLTPISKNLSTMRETTFHMGTVLVILWVVFLILSSSNGVNLADGLDGLASGTSIMTFLAFVMIGVWEFRQSCALDAVGKCYLVRDPLDLAVLAAAFAGACAGFLWWNTSPAKKPATVHAIIKAMRSAGSISINRNHSVFQKSPDPRTHFVIQLSFRD